MRMLPSLPTGGEIKTWLAGMARTFNDNAREANAYNNKFLIGRLRIDRNAVPTGPTDVVGADTEHDVLYDANFIYVLVRDGTSFVWKTAPFSDFGKASKKLSVNTTSVGNVLTGEDDLISYTVPGGTLADAGDTIHFHAAGTFANTLNARRIRVKFGGTTILDTGSLAIMAAADWEIEGRIIRTGAATQKNIVSIRTSSAVLVSTVDYSTSAITLASDAVLKLTGEATATNDVVNEFLIVRLER